MKFELPAEDIARAESALKIAVKNSYPDLTCKLELRASWGSNEAYSRKAIRTQLYHDFLAQFSSADKAHIEVEDLTQPPRVSGYSISIAHSLEVGGFAWCKGPRWLGLDIEDPKRVTAPIAKRISNSTEISLAPSNVSLWCTKEASFKALALSGAQIKTISECHCLNWRPSGTPSVVVVDIGFSEKNAGKSFLYETNDLAVALFISNPST